MGKRNFQKWWSTLKNLHVISINCLSITCLSKKLTKGFDKNPNHPRKRSHVLPAFSFEEDFVGVEDFSLGAFSSLFFLEDTFGLASLSSTVFVGFDDGCFRARFGFPAVIFLALGFPAGSFFPDDAFLARFLLPMSSSDSSSDSLFSSLSEFTGVSSSGLSGTPFSVSSSLFCSSSSSSSLSSSSADSSSPSAELFFSSIEVSSVFLRLYKRCHIKDEKYWDTENDIKSFKSRSNKKKGNPYMVCFKTILFHYFLNHFHLSVRSQSNWP